MAIKTLVGQKPYTLGTSVTNSTATLANKQVIAEVIKTSDEPGITSVNRGKVASFVPLPKSFTIKIENTNDAEVDAILFNLDDFEAATAGVTYTYSDGYAGKLINKLINGLQNADGLLIYGFNILGKDEDGDKSDEVVNNSQLEVRYYNGNGKGFAPVPIDVAGAERNTQFKDGLFTIKTQFVLNFLSQFKAHLGAGESISFVFNLQPIVG